MGIIFAFLCRLRSIAAHRDHFVRHLSVCPSVCLSNSHTFLIVTHSYVSQATDAFLGMLPLCFTKLVFFFNFVKIKQTPKTLLRKWEYYRENYPPVFKVLPTFCVKFWYSNQTFTLSSLKGWSHLTDKKCRMLGLMSKHCRLVVASID